MLVNMNRIIADERGATHIIIDPSKYTGEEPMNIKIISQYWIKTPFWEDYKLTLQTTSFFSFLAAGLTAKSAQ